MTNAGYFAVAALLTVGSIAWAQQSGPANTNLSSSTALNAPSVEKLDFAVPTDVRDVDAGATVAGRFDCGTDGTIYALVRGYSSSPGIAQIGSLALLGIHPDGTVTNFPWLSVPGFGHISPPKSVFVGNGRVYVLINGDRKSPPQERMPRYPLILSFDSRGSLVGTVVLEQDSVPLTIGVFPSGNAIVVSHDTLNHSMALDLINQQGIRIRRLQLRDADFVVRAAGMPAEASVAATYSPALLIAMSKFYSWNGNLLLVPLQTSGLPIIELSESGVVHSAVPQLPEGSILGAFIPSDGPDWEMRLGTLLQSKRDTFDGNGKLLDIATRASNRVVEASPGSGRLLREFDLGGNGVQPACETNGTFRLLTSSDAGGRLQVVAAVAR